jgi:hypothetical protein
MPGRQVLMLAATFPDGLSHDFGTVLAGTQKGERVLAKSQHGPRVKKNGTNVRERSRVS